MLVREFLVYLQRQRPEISQSEIARRSGLSQTYVNKIVLDPSVKAESRSDALKRVAQAFPGEWRAFVASNKKAEQELSARYGWAFPTRRSGPVEEGAPEFVQAVRQTRRIFESGSVPAKKLVLNLIQLAEELVAATGRAGARRRQKKS